MGAAAALMPGLRFTQANFRQPRPRRPLAVPVAAAQSPQDQRRRRRLVDTILQAPRRVELYFSSSLLRRMLWCFISYAGGYYAGNVVTLSFGALAINDVLAAAITVVFYEVVTNAFYEAEEKTLRLFFANSFKIGVVTSMLADAIKLGG